MIPGTVQQFIQVQNGNIFSNTDCCATIGARLYHWTNPCTIHSDGRRIIRQDVDLCEFYFQKPIKIFFLFETNGTVIV